MLLQYQGNSPWCHQTVPYKIRWFNLLSAHLVLLCLAASFLHVLACAVTSSSLFETLSTLRSSPTASSIKRNCNKLRFTKPWTYLGLKHNWQGHQNVARVVRIEMRRWTQHQLLVPHVVQSSTKHLHLPTKSICTTDYIPFLGHTVLWLEAHEVDTCWLCSLLELHAMCLESRKGFPPDSGLLECFTVGFPNPWKQDFPIFHSAFHSFNPRFGFLDFLAISFHFQSVHCFLCVFLPFPFNNFLRCSCDFLSLSLISFRSHSTNETKIPFGIFAGRQKSKILEFSAQNYRIKNRVKKGLGWFGRLAVYFTAIPPHVHYKGVDNHLWRPWCTPSIPEKHSHPNPKWWYLS